jgi:hypothetical protein
LARIEGKHQCRIDLHQINHAFLAAQQPKDPPLLMRDPSDAWGYLRWKRMAKLKQCPAAFACQSQFLLRILGGGFA